MPITQDAEQRRTMTYKWQEILKDLTAADPTWKDYHYDTMWIESDVFFFRCVKTMPAAMVMPAAPPPTPPPVGLAPLDGTVTLMVPVEPAPEEP